MSAYLDISKTIELLVVIVGPEFLALNAFIVYYVLELRML